MGIEARPGSLGAIVVGAGSGRRMGGREKAFLPVLGRPMLAHSVEVLERTPEVDSICLVLAAASVPTGAALVHQQGWKKVAAIVPGGHARQDSVRAGLAALPGCEWLLVHDAARPLITPDVVRRGLAAARRSGAAAAATPVRDTLKRVRPEGGGVVAATIPRNGLWAAQTPQVFRAAVLVAAFEAAGAGAGEYTDDAALVEAMGHEVHVFDGAIDNLKVTVPEDVPIVEALLRARGGGRPPPPRVGTGYDLHRTVPARRLVLGGVEISADFGLAGHSDGDALTHAVIDALLGACGLPNIGQQFPPTDPRYAGADSRALLAEAGRLARAAGWEPVNVDATLVCERPQLAPFLPLMRARLAEALALPPASVSVKAKTNEGVDAVGRGEAIAAQAIILVTARAGD
jgi:2-C-methyl-D-erythritol 4-phosphate cytidylyltransferase/2-C-methyl-D-erythritol 2,4-cyclodiphosphate synthase